MKALFHPKYWLTWILMGMWALISQLPLPVLRGIARCMAFTMRWLAPKRSFIAYRNLSLCFPEKSPEELRAMVRKNMYHTWMGMFETGMSWFWSKRRLQKLFVIEGAEQVAGLESGALLLGMHFTTLEMTGVAVNSTVSRVDMMYRPHKNPVYDFIQTRQRTRHHEACRLIDRADVRGTLRRLREGRVVWYAPDQDYGIKQGVFADFFGIPAATITATSRFAKVGRVPVIPILDHRGNDGRYYIKILPPLADFPSGDDVADAERVNAMIESAVREYPEQYLWVHRRFKTRPPGERGVYGKLSKKVVPKPSSS
ncbi:LpxL/LpxP family Kdo(2)-lipid IV(A) lauroyl/palmitoleoyl acyltransferase [Marinibactrum halimedae]|nr:LpxL/LpxP family Kdo(2)-lipid IV(A) lauroyl/palmitoleoyl acyltransferase [Marinibactrum halimedae]MCD9460170.1 LpxL/LpxP family Kdo(2)-lipid IV(A) lauroyl/palmitoleoyl acyltransferase [Marinibactrum halimedae]